MCCGMCEELPLITLLWIALRWLFISWSVIARFLILAGELLDPTSGVVCSYGFSSRWVLPPAIGIRERVINSSFLSFFWTGLPVFVGVVCLYRCKSRFCLPLVRRETICSSPYLVFRLKSTLFSLGCGSCTALSLVYFCCYRGLS
jgi:hypothetical protein